MSEAKKSRGSAAVLSDPTEPGGHDPEAPFEDAYGAFASELRAAVRNGIAHGFAAPLVAEELVTRLGLKLAQNWPPMAEQLRMSVGPAGSIEMLFSTEQMLFEITVGPGNTDLTVYAQARPSGVETEVECKDISQVMSEIAKLRAA